MTRVATARPPPADSPAIIWHDWFATSNAGVGSQKWMLNQNSLFRKHALGNFESLLIAVTHDPAMLIWLNGRDNTKWSPNENYARELMELFTLGARKRVHGGRRPRAGQRHSPARETGV